MRAEPPQADHRRARTRFLVTLLVVAALLGACTSGSERPDPGEETSPSTTDGADPSPDDETGTTSPVIPGVVVLDGETGYSNEAPGYFGNPIWATGPGNLPVAADNQLAIRFVARRNGLIGRASFNIKFDFERDGYHGGDCGELEVTLRTDDGGFPSEDVLATMVIADPCGGGRTIGWLTDEPFETPALVTGGGLLERQ